MLRIIVITLFLANLLLLAFQCSQPGTREETVTRQSVAEDTGIPTIHLFSELMEDEGLMSGNRLCFTLGPFHSSEDMDEVRSQLQEVSAEISERETRALVEKGYWVFLPPYATLLEANETLLSLQALGLKDVGVIYEGEWKRAISLGYFLRQENAVRRLKAVRARGFEPKIRVKRQSEPRYWLDYEQDPGSGLLTLDMAGRPNDFMQRAMPCPERTTVEEPASAEEIAVNTEPAQQQVTTAEETVEEAPEDVQEDVQEEKPQAPVEEIAAPQAVPVSEPTPSAQDNLQAEGDGSSQLKESIVPDTGESTDPQPLDSNEAAPDTAGEAPVVTAPTELPVAAVPEDSLDAGSQNSDQADEPPVEVSGSTSQEEPLEYGGEAQPAHDQLVEEQPVAVQPADEQSQSVDAQDDAGMTDLTDAANDISQQLTEIPVEVVVPQAGQDAVLNAEEIVKGSTEESVIDLPLEAEAAEVADEVEKSVGTGPLHNFSIEPETDTGAEPEKTNETASDTADGTVPETGAETEPQDSGQPDAGEG